jgi:DNA-binding CsgD family transcriptional regulator
MFRFTGSANTGAMTNLAAPANRAPEKGTAGIDVANLRSVSANRAGPESSDLWTSLTPRERHVAIAVAGGASNRQVAAALSMAVKTVECHLGRIYTKLGVTSRVQLAVAIGIPSQPDLQATRPALSASERRIVALVGAGMTTRLAAKHLYLNPKTVEYHLGRIYRKLQINSRCQLLDVLVNLDADYIVAAPEPAA